MGKEKRFLRRKKLMNSVSEVPRSLGVDSQQHVAIAGKSLSISNSCGDVFDGFERDMQSRFDFNGDSATVSVSMSEVESLVEDIRSQWDSAKLDEMITQCRKQVISSIVGPLGLGSVVAAYDKTGGNVTTTHNANKDIYARPCVEGYDRCEYTGSYDYRRNSLKYRDSKSSSDFTFHDEYTGNQVYYRDGNVSSVDVDHIKSTNQYHRDGGFIQGKQERKSFGCDEKNFAVTSNSINRSLQDKDKKEWASLKNKEDPSKTNAEFYGIDQDSLDDAIQRGEEAVQKHAPTQGEWVKYYGGRLAVTSSIEAGKMGLQQAVGLLLTDLFEALFIEIKDSYDNGFVSGVGANKFFEALSVRCSSVGRHILSDWKKVVSSFKDGAISGFFSNIVTTVINTFCTTAKNIVRMIREGFFSLLKAFKLLLFRPEGMASAQAADAALKLVAAGVITIGGVTLQESLNSQLGLFFSAVPVVKPYGDVIVSIAVGGVTGIVTSLAIYALDKLDIFGVHDEERHQYVIKIIRQKSAETEVSIQNMFDAIVSV